MKKPDRKILNPVGLITNRPPNSHNIKTCHSERSEESFKAGKIQRFFVTSFLRMTLFYQFAHNLTADIKEPTSTSRSANEGRANEGLSESGEGTDCKAIRTSPHCLSEGEFAGACAERGEKSHRVCFARRRSGVERERLVCFSFASVFFCTSKENAQTDIR